MLDQFLSKIVEQSLDEIEHKNISLTAPLSVKKFENILRSNFGEKASVVDLSNPPTLSDFCVMLTNLENDALVLIKNINESDDEFVEMLTHLLSRRQIYLIVGEGELQKDVYLDIAKIYFLTVTDNGEIKKPLNEYFNVKINLSQNELPEPIKLSNNGKAGDSETVLSAEDFISTIYNWRDERRTPNLENDIETLKHYIANDKIFEVWRAYINYLTSAYDFHEDSERDLTAPLTKFGGIYDEYIFEADKLFVSNWETRSDMEENTAGCDFDSLAYFFSETRSVDEKRELLYRYLAIYKNLSSTYNGGELDESIFEIPTEFESNYKAILSSNLEEACFEMRSQTQVSDYNSSDSIDDEIEENESYSSNNVSIVWHIDAANFEFDDVKDIKTWLNEGKPIQFEFDPTTSDDGGNSVFDDPEAEATFFELNPENSELKIQVNESNVVISAWVKFNINLKEDVDQSQFEEWASENGGISCGTINLKDIDATITSDDGQELRWNN